MSEKVNEAVLLNMRFDDDRSRVIIGKDEQDLTVCIQEHRLQILDILSDYEKERRTLLASLCESRDERLRFLTDKLTQVRQRYIMDLEKSECTGTRHGFQLVQECDARLREVESEIAAGFMEQTSSHLRGLESIYTKAIQDLQLQIGSQKNALELVLQLTERNISLTEASLEDTRQSIQACENEFISAQAVQALEDRYNMLKHQLLEADRQNVAVRNFRRACSTLTTRVHDLRSSILGMR